jgi:hypothetical protein
MDDTTRELYTALAILAAIAVGLGVAWLLACAERHKLDAELEDERRRRRAAENRASELELAYLTGQPYPEPRRGARRRVPSWVELTAELDRGAHIATCTEPGCDAELVVRAGESEQLVHVTDGVHEVRPDGRTVTHHTNGRLERRLARP